MPSLTRIAAALTFATAASLPTLSHAALVSASYSALGGNDWHVSFTITNDGTLAGIPGLTVHFDADLFSNLANAVAPAGWDPLIFAFDPDLPSDPAYDVLALPGTDALLPGQSLGGFGLNFSYLGTGAPGALPYELYSVDDNFNVTILFQGETVTVNAVPEPGTSWLLAAALGGLMLTRRRSGSAA